MWLALQQQQRPFMWLASEHYVGYNLPVGHLVLSEYDMFINFALTFAFSFCLALSPGTVLMTCSQYRRMNSCWRPAGAMTKTAGNSMSSMNPYIQAAMAEARRTCTYLSGNLDGDEGSYSDLEDFIVCKPERSYKSLFAQHYKYSTHE